MSVHRLALSLVALALLTVAGQACEAPAASPERASFPLRVADGKRHLEDAAGRPFLMHGDTAWSLIADLTREEADLYLRDRQERRFNTLLVNLIEHAFARNAPANAYGDTPFLVAGDYATPNPAYFDHARWVLDRACERGFVVLLTPSYVGNGGGGEGWYQAMVASGAAKMLGYGRYVGERFGDLSNIVWVHGGDYNPPDRELIRAMVQGIRETDTDALHTAHNSPGWAALEYWRGEPWLSVNNVYTYEPVHEAVLGQYAEGDGMPFFLMEAAYENEHGADEHRVRAQAYQALLSGASGHVYGNNPIWHFGGPGIYQAPGSWQEELDSRGARSMTVLYDLLSATEWWLLEPDADGELLIGGRGGYDERAVAARARDGSFALVYMPTGRVITLDLAPLDGASVEARWHDPSSGETRVVEGSPFPGGSRQTLVPGPSNRSGYSDWILELTAEGVLEARR
jgi:Protein of unknown function (DUF4038)/Putative collagen-binding domain of a collagenase